MTARKSIIFLSDKLHKVLTHRVRSMSTSAPSSPSHDRSKCIFCKICDGLEPSNIVHKDEEFVVFPDIRPAAPHHYLIVPRQHYTDARALSKEHIPMVEKMVILGKEVLATQGAADGCTRFGFHWPPFHSVSHLHLHVIAPESEMGLIARGMFKSNSFWFVTPETVISRLECKL